MVCHDSFCTSEKILFYELIFDDYLIFHLVDSLHWLLTIGHGVSNDFPFSLSQRLEGCLGARFCLFPKGRKAVRETFRFQKLLGLVLNSLMQWLEEQLGIFSLF